MDSDPTARSAQPNAPATVAPLQPSSLLNPNKDTESPSSSFSSRSPSPSASVCTTTSSTSSSSFSSSSSSPSYRYRESSQQSKSTGRPTVTPEVKRKYQATRRVRPRAAGHLGSQPGYTLPAISDSMSAANHDHGAHNLLATLEVTPVNKELQRAPLMNSEMDAQGDSSPLPDLPQQGSLENELSITMRPRHELKVRVYDLPSEITTRELWSYFSQYGPVDDIEISEKQERKPMTSLLVVSAFLKFRRYPKKNFLNRRIDIPLDSGGICSARVAEIDKFREIPTIASPVDENVRYPERFEIPAKTLEFGFMIEETTMMSMFTAQRASEKPLKIEFEVDLFRKQLDIRFVVMFKTFDGKPKQRREKYRMRIPFIALANIYDLTPDDQDQNLRSILIPLQHPPQVWRRIHDVAKTHDETGRTRRWTEWDAWFRQTDIVENSLDLIHEPLAIRKTKPTIDIGRWTTYRLYFDLKEYSKAGFDLMIRALKDFNILLKDMPAFRMSEDQNLPVWDAIDPPSKPKSTDESYLELMLDDYSRTPLSYPLRYQVEACISQGCISEYNMTKPFIDKLVDLDTRRPGQAVKLLEAVVDQGKRYYDPMDIFSLDERPRSKNHIPQYCVETRKATITPTMIYFSNPAVETSNRVIRHFFTYKERFLRVQFTDEKLHGKISATEGNNSNELFTRVKRAMLNGIKIGDRHFQFLAFGNSQLRQHGAYFFAEGPDLSCDDIRKWMGNFENIKIIAKYAARLGQCFSTTRAIHGFKVKDTMIPDVERNGFCFTDGCGTISQSAAQLIAAEFRFQPDQVLPCAFQFRLGGCKGVLAVDPNLKRVDVNDGRFQVCVRKSQRKFEAEHNVLEIIRCSSYSVATLNRQLVQVLSDLGVEAGVFLKKLQNQLIAINNAMEDQKTALSVLSKHVDANGGTLRIASLISDGFMATKEPFLSCLLHLWRAWSIKMLKEKARIAIDNGCFLLGVVDETGTLKGHYEKEHQELKRSQIQEESLKIGLLPEIFVQVPDQSAKGKFKIIEGPCLLARNPSLHPGDLRVVRAVDCLGLRHLTNVVVLPQTGDRPIANMCSGGDLDGDDYIVIWDGSFIPPNVNQVPMDYTPPEPKLAEHGGVTISDITTFFVNYMKNDTLGAIANAHLATADRIPTGVFSEKCLELAMLHSRAVDFPKTGVGAKMPKNLRIREWPHFFEKHLGTNKKFYQSSNILGQLYDAVDKVAFRPEFHTEGLKFDERILNAFGDIDEKALNIARDLKLRYDEALRRIMAQHEIRTEFEIWSTFVLSHTSFGSDYKFHEDMKEICVGLLERFEREVRIELRTDNEYIIGRFAATMYKITKDEYTKALEDGDPLPMISFPWVFPNLLGKIAKQEGVFARDPTTGLCVTPDSAFAPYSVENRMPKKGENRPKGNGQKGDSIVIVGSQRKSEAGEELKWEDGLPPMVTMTIPELDELLAQEPLGEPVGIEEDLD